MLQPITNRMFVKMIGNPFPSHSPLQPGSCTSLEARSPSEAKKSHGVSLTRPRPALYREDLYNFPINSPHCHSRLLRSICDHLHNEEVSPLRCMRGTIRTGPGNLSGRFTQASFCATFFPFRLCRMPLKYPSCTTETFTKGTPSRSWTIKRDRKPDHFFRVIPRGKEVNRRGSPSKPMKARF
jgi:hypothetical protein